FQPATLREDTIVVNELLALDIQVVGTEASENLVRLHLTEPTYPVLFADLRRGRRLRQPASWRLFDAQVPAQRVTDLRLPLETGDGGFLSGREPNAGHPIRKVYLDVGGGGHRGMEKDDRLGTLLESAPMLRDDAALDVAVGETRQVVPLGTQC